MRRAQDASPRRPLRAQRDGRVVRGSHPAPRGGRTNGYDPSRRYRLIMVAIVVLALAVSGKLMWVQGLNSQALAQQARDARLYEREITALRGDISDRNGDVLATSVERYDIWVNQTQITDYRKDDDDARVKGPKAAAIDLAPVLGISPDDLEDILTGNAGFKYVKRKVEPQVRDAVQAMRIPGIGSDRVQERLYPSGQVAANVIGFTGSDGTALAGAELTLDKELRGTNGKVQYERGAGGQAIPTAEHSQTPAIEGKDVQLTIDRDIQYRAQEIIAQTVQKWGAAGGSIVVLNVHSGDVLGLADYPTYDPNNPGDSDAKYRGNQSISNVFEPGSTGKLFTMATLLNEGKATIGDQLKVPSTKVFRGERIKDSHPHPVMNYTLAGVLRNSSNVGTVELATRVDPSTRYDYLRAFGLGEPTGVELPGESAGILHPVDQWRGRTVFTTTFGQGYAVNALQMTSAVGTFGNDGVRVQPRVVKSVRDEEGNVQPQPPGKSVRVVSPETAADMLRLLDNDVKDQPGVSGVVPHYATGAKSGTAEASDGTYTSSFIGMAPIDDPDIVVGVFVYGVNGFNSGTEVASPAFSEMMSYTLQSESIAPTGVKGVELENEWK